MDSGAGVRVGARAIPDSTAPVVGISASTGFGALHSLSLRSVQPGSVGFITDAENVVLNFSAKCYILSNNTVYYTVTQAFFKTLKKLL